MAALSPAIINTYEAKTHLSKLLERVAAGEELIIGKAGKPIARLSPYEPPAEPRIPTGGHWKGRVFIRSDFDDPLDPEVQAAFEGRMP